MLYETIYLLCLGLPAARQEEMIDHRLTDREWAEEWKHLDHVRFLICKKSSNVIIKHEEFADFKSF